MQYNSKLWKDLVLFFEIDFVILDLTAQVAFLGYLNANLKLAGKGVLVFCNQRNE